MIRVWEANEAPITATAGGREKGPSCPVVCASCKRRPASKPVDTMNDSQGSLERNIAAFNADAAALGGYAYTAIDRWSARHATRRHGKISSNINAEFFAECRSCRHRLRRRHFHTGDRREISASGDMRDRPGRRRYRCCSFTNSSRSARFGFL